MYFPMFIRSRSRDRTRDRKREDSRDKMTEEEREKDRERRKRGLPPVVKEKLSGNLENFSLLIVKNIYHSTVFALFL